MAKIVLYLFFIGHVLGDFYLQSSELAINKDESFKKLMKHSVMYLISMVFVTGPVFSLKALIYALILSISHFLVDLVKFFMKNRIIMNDKREVWVFLIDQIIHVLIIVFATAMIYFSNESISYIGGLQNVLNDTAIDFQEVLSWALSLLIIIKPVSVTIKKLLYPYRPMRSEDGGHPNAGAFIGVLERCIILMLLSVGQYSAIGFVLTAKSIARYKKIVDDPKFSEYYLLGTLLSAMTVIATYLIVF